MGSLDAAPIHAATEVAGLTPEVHLLQPLVLLFLIADVVPNRKRTVSTVALRDLTWRPIVCQIASNSDPHFASNVDPSSRTARSLSPSCIGGTRARSSAPPALRGAEGAGGPCA